MSEAKYWAGMQAETAAQIRRCRFWQRAARQMLRRSEVFDQTKAAMHALQRAETLMEDNRRWYVRIGERAAGRSDDLL